jgi:hypothetical protein
MKSSWITLIKNKRNERNERKERNIIIYLQLHREIKKKLYHYQIHYN